MGNSPPHSTSKERKHLSLKRENVILPDTRGPLLSKKESLLKVLLVAWVQCSRFNYVTLFDTGGKPCEHLWWVSEVGGHRRLHSLLALVGASFSTADTQLRHIRKKKPKPLLFGCHTNNVGTCNLYHTVKSTSWILEQQHLNSNQSRQFQCRGLIISMQSHHLGF